MTSMEDVFNYVTLSHENFSSNYDYLYDSHENNQQRYQSLNYSGSSQRLAKMLQQLAKMFNNQSSFPSDLNFPLLDSTSSSLFPYETFLPSSVRNTNSYHLLTSISLWFVLIINPIVVNSRLIIFYELIFHFI